MPHEVHLAFTRFDAPLAGNIEILANLTTLGLKFTQAPQWKQGSKKPTIVASADCMTQLLWDYLVQASVCTNDMAMSIQMDRQQEDDTQDFYCHGELSRYGRATLTAADIPNNAQPASGPRISMLKSSLEALNHGIVHCLSMGWWNSASGRRRHGQIRSPPLVGKTLPYLSERKRKEDARGNRRGWRRGD